MKIVQLATSLQGGAGSAALRMNNALNVLGAESTMVSRDGILGKDKIEFDPINMSLSRKLESSAVTLLQSKLIQKSNDLVTPLSISTLNIQDEIFVNADVIHIHAYYNFLSTISLRKIVELGKPTLFTLHDQRFFTGGCHYSRDCRNFQENCSGCPQTRKPFDYFVKRTFSKQREILKFSKNVELISPSRWLAELAKRGAVSGNLPMHVVRNPIPRIYFDTPIPFERKSERIMRVAFIATNLQNPYKDLKVLTEAINIYCQFSSKEICVVLVGHGAIPVFEAGVLVENFQPNSDSEMAHLLSTIDLVVVPSNQDNSPSVIGEALAAGVFVIGSDAGGIPEILRDFEMPIFPVGDANQLAALIDNFQEKTSRDYIREKAKKYFGEEILGRELLEIYRTLHLKLLEKT
jgi:glycosyltransferase involved in cell wall biosynthesis